MVIAGSNFICVAVVVCICSSAFLPGGDTSNVDSKIGTQDNVLPSEPKETCAGRRSRRLPNIATVDVSVIDSDYMDSLLKAVNVNSRSLSPWEHRVNADPDRFPSVISEADCFTFTCIGAEGTEDPDLISSPIQQDIMVLRRHQRDCDYTYSLETERVTVGCTCVRSQYTYY